MTTTSTDAMPTSSLSPSTGSSIAGSPQGSQPSPNIQPSSDFLNPSLPSQSSELSSRGSASPFSTSLSSPSTSQSHSSSSSQSHTSPNSSNIPLITSPISWDKSLQLLLFSPSTLNNSSLQAGSSRMSSNGFNSSNTPSSVNPNAATAINHSSHPGSITETGQIDDGCCPKSAGWIDSHHPIQPHHHQLCQPQHRHSHQYHHQLQSHLGDFDSKSSLLTTAASARPTGNPQPSLLPLEPPPLSPHQRSSLDNSSVTVNTSGSGLLNPSSDPLSAPPSNISPIAPSSSFLPIDASLGEAILSPRPFCLPSSAQLNRSVPPSIITNSSDLNSLSRDPLTISTTPSPTPTTTITPIGSLPAQALTPSCGETLHEISSNLLQLPPQNYSIREPITTNEELRQVGEAICASSIGASPSNPSLFHQRGQNQSVIPTAARPITEPFDRWDQNSFGLSVAFTGAIYRSQPQDLDSDQDGSAPPAFFPLQRVGFSPQLKVHSPLANPNYDPHVPTSSGLPLSIIGGMTLGVTGVVSVPSIDKRTGQQARDSKTNSKKWKVHRVVVDFVTDLSHGLQTWKNDAEIATQQINRGGKLREVDGMSVLPPGTYILPLSMKIPASEKLPPSFSCSHFRITYTMSLALWSRASDSVSGQPLHCKVFTVPFDILPSTLPSGPPKLPRLVWEDRSVNGASAWGGMWEGIKRAISGGSSNGGSSSSFSGSGAGTLSGNNSSNSGNSVNHIHRKRSIATLTAQIYGSSAGLATSTATHVVVPSLTSSSFSPASHASIPVTLSIIDRPIVPTDLYLRISLIRSIYVRDSKTDWISEAAESLLTEEGLLEKHLKEEKEICSRWGYIPYRLRPHANPLEECEVLIRDLSVPLISEGEISWGHGYSTSLELEPSVPPQIDYNPVTGSSWFSPAFRRKLPSEKEYGRHLHVSVRFAIAIEIGFAKAQDSDCPSGENEAGGVLFDVLEQVQKRAGEEFVIPKPHTFTKASVPKFSRKTGANLTNPFPNINQLQQQQQQSFSKNSSRSSTLGPLGTVGHRYNHSLPNNSINGSHVGHKASMMIPSSSSAGGSNCGSSSNKKLHHHRSSSSLIPASYGNHDLLATEPIKFPGKIRTLRCPIVIGSVAEPNLSCLVIPETERRHNQQSGTSLPSQPGGSNSTREGNLTNSEDEGSENQVNEALRNEASGGEHEEELRRRRREEEEAEDMRRAIEAVEPTLVGDGETWICAPPDYLNSLNRPPAYLY